VGTRLEQFNVPAHIGDRFPEYVWAVVISGQPQLNTHWLAFVAGTAAAMRTFASADGEDPYGEFFQKHLRSHTHWPQEEYYDYVLQMVSAVDTAIKIRARKWRFGA